MGFYERRIFPWLNDKLCADAEIERLRSETLKDAGSRVLEVGFGTGLNLPRYPEGVTSLVAVEPNEGMLQRAEGRIREARFPVEVVRSGGETLPLPDASFDTAVLVLTLCSVADPDRVASEIRRVLKPDGRLLVLEHGLSSESGVARWQRRLNPIQKIVACGCNINRPIADIVTRAGFQFESIRQFYVPKMPRPHGWMTMGVAGRTIR